MIDILYRANKQLMDLIIICIFYLNLHIDNILKNLKNKDKSDFEKAIGFLKGTMDAEEKLNLIVKAVKQSYSKADAIFLKQWL